MEYIIRAFDGREFKGKEDKMEELANEVKAYEKAKLERIEFEYKRIAEESTDALFGIGTETEMGIDIVRLRTLEDVNRFNAMFDTYKYRSEWNEVYNEEQKPTRDSIGDTLLVCRGYDDMYMEILGTVEEIKARFLEAMAKL